MKDLNIRYLMQEIHRFNIKTTDDNGIPSAHWIVPEECSVKPRDILLSFVRALGIAPSGAFVIRRRRSCSNERCVCPDCYNLTFKTRLKLDPKNTTLSREEIAELAEDIDYERCIRVGEKTYLSEFNDGVPEFLKITARQLHDAVVYHKNYLLGEDND